MAENSWLETSWERTEFGDEPVPVKKVVVETNVPGRTVDLTLMPDIVFNYLPK